MTSTLAEIFTETTFNYSYDRTPRLVPDIRTARQSGLNCEALAHLAIQHVHGQRLPADLRCYELFHDTQYTTAIDGGVQAARLGDILWLGSASSRYPVETFVPSFDKTGDLANWEDWPAKHLGVCSGELDTDLAILHASPEEGRVVQQSLSEVMINPRYQTIYAIKRVLAA